MWEGMQGPVNVAPYSTLGCLNSIETSDKPTESMQVNPYNTTDSYIL